MVIKMNNKYEKFYHYMGRMFGSRLVERQTNDRIYDDNNKDWYTIIDDDRIVAFISITNDVIKNIYSVKDKYLEEILVTVGKDKKIAPSIVTNLYQNVSAKAGFKVDDSCHYKNFVIISN